MHFLAPAGYSVPLQMCKYKSENNKPAGYGRNAFCILGNNINLVSQYLQLLSSLHDTFYT